MKAIMNINIRGKAIVYADGKSPWTVSRKHEDQYKIYERWNYCKGADE